MLSFWESFAINIVATLVRAAIKNPTKYAAVANQLDTIAQEILTAFPPAVPSAEAATAGNAPATK